MRRFRLVAGVLSILAAHCATGPGWARDGAGRVQPVPARGEAATPQSPPTPAPAPGALTATPAPPVQQKRFGDWAVYRHEAAGESTCYAVVRPGLTRAERGSPGGASLFVTSWPRSGIKAEVSVHAGVPLRRDAPLALLVGGQAFTPFLSDDGRAFVNDAVAELKLLEAMKKGDQLLFKSLTERGEPLALTFSLAGLNAALAYLAQGCA